MIVAHLDLDAFFAAVEELEQPELKKVPLVVGGDPHGRGKLPDHLPVERFVPPEEFDEIGVLAKRLGFGMVASGPFVRSSYHAGEMAAGIVA